MLTNHGKLTGLSTNSRLFIEWLTTRLIKNQSAQGGDNQPSKDRDNDPKIPKDGEDGEPPGSSTTPGKPAKV